MSVQKSYLKTRIALRGIALTLTLLSYHCLIFLVSLSLAISLSTCLTQAYNRYFGSKLGIDIIAIMTLFLLAGFAQEALQIQVISNFGNRLEKKKKKYHTALITFPTRFYAVLFVASISNLYYQFMVVHKISPEVNKLNFKEFSGNPFTVDIGNKGQFGSLMFLLSIAYMVFVIARENDSAVYRRGLTRVTCRTCSCFRSFCYFSFVQIVMLFAYGLPLLCIVLVSSKIDIPFPILYPLMIVSAFLIGAKVIEYENESPFPTQPLQGPHYYYESLLFARSVLCIALPTSIVAFFFAPYENDAQVETLFYLYSIAVSLTVLQVTKVLINAERIKKIQEKLAAQDEISSVTADYPMSDRCLSSCDISTEAESEEDEQGEFTIFLSTEEEK